MGVRLHLAGFIILRPQAGAALTCVCVWGGGGGGGGRDSLSGTHTAKSG